MIALSAIVFLLAGMVLLVCAYGADGFAHHEMTVSYNVRGTAHPSSYKGHFVLTALDGAPMPGGEASLNLEVSAGVTGSFGDITYDNPGIYRYEISRVYLARDGQKADTATYEVTVAVLSDSSVKAVYSRIGTGKTDEVVYEDRIEKRAEKRIEKQIERQKENRIIAPETGDEPGLLWFVLACMAGAMLMLIISFRTRMQERGGNHE